MTAKEFLYIIMWEHHSDYDIIFEKVISEYGSKESALAAMGVAQDLSADYRRYFEPRTNTCTCGVCEWCMLEFHLEVGGSKHTTIEDNLLMGGEISPYEERYFLCNYLY